MRITYNYIVCESYVATLYESHTESVFYDRSNDTSVSYDERGCPLRCFYMIYTVCFPTSFKKKGGERGVM
jgi:hypothetical protein